MATGLSSGAVEGFEAPALFGVGGLAPASVSSASRLGRRKPAAFACRIAGFDVVFLLAMVSPSCCDGNNGGFVHRSQPCVSTAGTVRSSTACRWMGTIFDTGCSARRKEPDMERRNAILSLVIAAIIIVGFLIGFLYADMGWRTSPLERAQEQNQGGNAPADTSPAAGIEKNPQENTEMPDQQ
ncbi:hypothetical protein [Mesorhizobium sp.]|uniref:hypothetical protein n=1 Tax=Mesorhizobium sp. TaxID=1871066 RepID=UPI00257A43F1|nr:hypothetical protein [Mesorhizobium sp.]